jgi:diguanylate cyclase (GGDEF)-like protein
VEKVGELVSALLRSVEEEGIRVEFSPHGRLYHLGEDLGRVRKQHGFAIEELVQEHLILRNAFWDVCCNSMGITRVVDYQLEKSINSCLDNLLLAAAKAYQGEFSREVRQNPLRDPLTGLFNFNYFQGRLGEELRRSIRYQHEITLVLFELENYFQLMEEEGGEKLKEIVKFIAKKLDHMTRECDVVARIGEGGFALLLPETGMRGGRIMAKRLSTFFLKELPALAAKEIAPVLRWGLASYPQEVQVPEKLYDCASRAMLRARFEAPDEVVVYRSSNGGGI